jgi:hypothetical protein
MTDQQQVMDYRRQQRADLLGQNQGQSQSQRIQERDEAVKEIVEQLTTANALAKDLSVLIRDQGVTLDRVDQNMSETQGHTDRAVDHLRTAERQQRQCIIC